MYLEKLEIQGFKSFANKNTLVFPGLLNKDKRGITSIVGPNGSGKSNIADAVRWALGEQSMKTLRGKKSEDVIFSGSLKKGRLGMAEVSLYLNNEDGQAPVDYSQIVLTRRLFRDGESEYLLNNSRVRLGEVQILLAKASFGQKTYSVIGQGTVEGFLNSSLAERKEFFDEATGVKQFQIKRDESLNKLRTSYENLHQGEILVAEIEPRLKSLTRQINKLRQREEIKANLRKWQLDYYSRVWQMLNGKFNDYNRELLLKEAVKMEKEKKLRNLNGELEKIEKTFAGSAGFREWPEKLDELEKEKSRINSRLAYLGAQIEVELEVKGEFDAAWFNRKERELSSSFSGLNEEMRRLEQEIGEEERKLKEWEKKKKETEARISEFNQNLNLKENGSAGRLKDKVVKLLSDLEAAEKIEDIREIRKMLGRIKAELSQFLREEKGEAGRGKEEELTVLAKQKEEAASRLNEHFLNISAKKTSLKLLKEKEEGLKKELEEIRKKLKAGKTGADKKDLIREKEARGKELARLEQAIAAAREKIRILRKGEEADRERIFSLQHQIQVLQNELNNLAAALNELKVNAARQETRLEDIEKEIRLDFGSLKEVKEAKAPENLNEEEAKEKISQFKRQLDSIGGLDAETEKEYTETKERFDFLSSQTADLANTISSLEKIIRELDLTIKEKFDKEFNAIAKKFEEYFKILFDGGNAKIIKVMAAENEEGKGEDESSGAEEKKAALEVFNADKIKFLQKHNATGLAGIEIQATPPGKKIRSIAMLSGGERALTAIALICAIISANPSPFVVLDEVDAALDEANSERLARILDDLSHKTQFILITHNRASMRRASVLYGVTMGDDGASRLLSVKLDEIRTEKKI